MLTVTTYLDRSTIHGIGLFAATDIAAGTLIWIPHAEVDITFQAEHWSRLRETVAEPAFQTMNKYAYKEEGVYYLSLDDSRFMNHSRDRANVSPDNEMLALRDIQQGEELLCDYSEFCDPDDVSMTAGWI